MGTRSVLAVFSFCLSAMVAFHDNHGLQCGFCTPGMLMTAVDMVRRLGYELEDRVVREQLGGNICRCTGYHNIVKSIIAGAKAMRPEGKLADSPEAGGMRESQTKRTG
jgi:xanthine dehydrogenase iron-sulfur cluster and FAD-binding subunit A